jgi:hypothetical protein
MKGFAHVAAGALWKPQNAPGAFAEKAMNDEGMTEHKGNQGIAFQP